MGKRTLSFVSLLAIGTLFTVCSVSSAKSVKADTTTTAHNFEAEDGIIEGTCGAPEEGFVLTQASENPDRETSGGKCVGNFQFQGNTITWKFNLNEEALHVDVSLWLATGQSSKSTSGFTLSINDTYNAKMTTATVSPSGDSWYYWREAKGVMSFPKGNNVMVFYNNNPAPWNIDNIVVNFPSTVTVSEFKTGEDLGEIENYQGEGTGGGGGQVIDPITPSTTKSYVKMEAEKCTSAEGDLYADVESYFTNDDNLSGGASTAYWGQVENQKLTFVVDAAEAVAQATFSVHCSFEGESVDLSTIVGIKINGTVMDLTGNGTGGCPTAWFDYVDIYSPKTALVKGENTFEVLAQGVFVDIDYCELRTEEDVEFSFHAVNHGFGSQTGPVNLEAEDGSIYGINSSDTPDIDEFVNPSTSTNERATSGGYCVEYMGNPGNSITWVIEVNKAVESFDAYIYLANCGPEGSNNENFTFTINGAPFSFTDDVFYGFAGGDHWYDWVGYKIGGCSLAQGTNTIVWTNTKGVNVNIDNLYLNLPDDVSTKVMSNADVTPPTISFISVLTDDIKTNSPVKISFEVSDDRTDADDISVSVTVYYEFGTENQEKVQYRSGSFTPTKLGDYTVIVTATDSRENEAKKIRHIYVDVEGEVPTKPDDGDKGGGTDVTYVDPKIVGGWITCAVSFTLIAGMVATMIVLKKKGF